MLAGVVTALVGFSSSFTVVLAGLREVGADQHQAASGLLTASVGMGLLGIWLSVRRRVPISIAWSTPGAALLLAGGPVRGGFGTAVAAFGVCGLLVVLTGLVAPLRAAMLAIPRPLANGLLAGVLLDLCLRPASDLVRSPVEVVPVVVVWLVMSRLARRWAVPAAMAVALGEIVARSAGRLSTGGHTLVPTLAVTAPHLSVQALTLGVSLFVVTMASQNLPGFAVLEGFGYQPPVKTALVSTGGLTMGTAVLGGHVLNMAAISAALCAGPDAGEDRAGRWVASTVAGGCYLMFGLSAGLLSTLVAVAPVELVSTVAGLALLGTLGASLAAATHQAESSPPGRREAAVITFLVTASGVSPLGIGSPFWGLVAGVAVLGFDAGVVHTRRSLQRATTAR